MAWHRLTHKQTGERVIVASLDGHDLSQWTALKIVRAPSEFQKINEDGSLTTDTARRAEVLRKAAIVGMDSAERFDKLMAEIEAIKTRLDKAGI